MTEKTPKLAGTTWVLLSFDDNPPLAGTEITASFGRDQRLTGTAGCNRYVGAYEVSGWSLAVGPLASTRIVCPLPGVMEQEHRYLAMLEDVVRIGMDGNQLLLADAAGARELLFARLPRWPEARLGRVAI